MRIAALWMGGLALWMGTLSLVLWLWTSDDLPPALLTGAAVALALIALYAGTVAEVAERPRRLATSSLPTVVLVIGLAMILNGFTFGLFLILIGAEVAALGFAGLVAQFVAERRAGSG
jgi:predicted tellurium resistance membrane protein TerC